MDVPMDADEYFLSELNPMTEVPVLIAHDRLRGAEDAREQIGTV